MSTINLAALDLNLFLAFEALYEERHVSKAGAKIGLSQPSMSHALRRLRELLDDELFVRGAGGMVPTALATELARQILPGLGQIRAAMDARGRFDAGASERRFVIGLNDRGSFQVLPHLMPRVRAQAPGVSLRIVNVGASDAVEQILSGEIDLACGVFFSLPVELESRKLGAQELVCVTDRRNPRLAGRALDLDAFLDLPHVQVAVNADLGIPVDAALGVMVLHRRVALVVPHYLSVPGSVLGTDMIGVCDTRSLAVRDWGPDLRIDPLPLPLPDPGYSAIWHRRSRSDPGHAWLRELIGEGAKCASAPDDAITGR